MGILCVAITALVEAWFEVLEPSDARRYVNTLKRAQLPDGGFAVEPLGTIGTLGTTAVCRAALRVCGVADSTREVRRADARLAELGGQKALRERLLRNGEPGALFYVMAGLMEADLLPPVSPDMAALPWSERMLEGRMHGGVPVVIYACAAVRERFLTKRLLPGFLRAPARLMARTRLAGFIGQFQNPNGSWNGMVFSTVLNLLALEGVGLTAADPMVERGFTWIDSRKRRTRDAASKQELIRIVPFDGENWETAFAIMALSVSGRKESATSIQRGAKFLFTAQSAEPQVRLNQPNPAAPREGGWTFMRGNERMADCDDTGVVLAALGLATTAKQKRPGQGNAAESIARGIAWLGGMQNDSGGFAVYVHGLPDKPFGEPMFVGAPLRLDQPQELLSGMVRPPCELGDPATSDLTGRVLWGLGECGLTVEHPIVKRAVAFFERDQRADGSFWGLWNPAYAASTAFALIGLARVRADLDAPFIQRAFDWLLSIQNPDGGFGETAEAFRRPELAGRGPSNAPLTGIVLRAIAEGVAGSRSRREPLRQAAERSASYLLKTQAKDGSWPNGDYRFTIIPPTFYVWDLHRYYYVLMGLGRWEQVVSAGSARRRR